MCGGRGSASVRRSRKLELSVPTRCSNDVGDRTPPSSIARAGPRHPPNSPGSPFGCRTAHSAIGSRRQAPLSRSPRRSTSVSRRRALNQTSLARVSIRRGEPGGSGEQQLRVALPQSRRIPEGSRCVARPIPAPDRSALRGRTDYYRTVVPRALVGHLAGGFFIDSGLVGVG